MKIIWFLLFFCFNLNCVTAFTNKIDGGRVGDQILNVIKTYYIAKIHGIPMVLTPFRYSEHFKFSQLLDPVSKYSYKYITQVGSISLPWEHSQPIKSINSDTLYQVSYSYMPEGFRHICRIDAWNGLLDDYALIQELHELLQIITPYEKLVLPHDKVSVALHIRRGSGGDLAWFKNCSHAEGQKKQRMAYPEKFSPLSFYRAALLQIYELVKRPIYVYIFTDDTSPTNLILKLKREGVENIDAEFACKSCSNPENDLIQDYANMLQFDCLVRSKSNFGQIAQLCKDYDIVIYPEKAAWQNQELIVTKSEIIINNPNYNQV